MKIIATTDSHFGHEMLVRNGYRPQGFEETLLNSIRASQGDLFLHLGDICFGDPIMWHERIMDSTNQFGKRILVRGNHDNNSYSWYLSHGWDMVVEFMQLRIDGKEVLFSHMPLLQEDVAPRLYHKPVINFHGHMHGKGKYSHRAEEVGDSIVTHGDSRLVFNYDIAPDSHKMQVVSINKLLSNLTKVP